MHLRRTGPKTSTSSGLFHFRMTKELHVSPLLSLAARAAVLPAATAGTWAGVLVPAIVYVATRRKVSLKVRIR